MLLPPAMKLGQGNVFTGVCDSVNRGDVCLSACWDTTPPRSRQTHWEQTPPEQTPQEQTSPPPPGSRHSPRSRHSQEQTPPRKRQPLRSRPPGSRPPAEADSIRSTSGLYASYWNAFLFVSHFPWVFRKFLEKINGLVLI